MCVCVYVCVCTYIYRERDIHTYMFYRHGRHPEVNLICACATCNKLKGNLTPDEFVKDASPSLIGWPSNLSNNLHFRISHEAKEIATCAADESLMCCDLLEPDAGREREGRFSEWGMMRLETLIEFKFLNSSYSSSNFSIRAVRADPPIEIRQTAPCR